MKEPFLRLAQRIRAEIPELERLVHRAQSGWDHLLESGDDLYLDSVALNLHGFYGGLERLFELIATIVDNQTPQGANWHKALLSQMSRQVPSVRPSVVTDETRDALDEFRGLRHVVRHAYAFNFEPEKLRPLVERAESVFERTRSELLIFVTFLEQQR